MEIFTLSLPLLLKKYFSRVLLLLLLLWSFCPASLYGQAASGPEAAGLLSQPGIIITIFLVLIPLLAALLFMVVKANGLYRYLKRQNTLDEASRFTAYLKTLDAGQIQQIQKLVNAPGYPLKANGAAASLPVQDDSGLLSNINENTHIRFIEAKRKALKRPQVSPPLSRLIIWFLVSATCWLVLGTTIGEYLGIKFLAPDIDHTSWLSFGRLRPVHTNAVFWGWSSLAMLGLGYYVVPRVGNGQIASLRLGWWSLYLVNAAVVLGSLALMAGINNGGGEYREYIWPIQLLFALGLVLTLVNFLYTVARRKTREIYVSNWYMVAAVIFAITICVVAYLPNWQNGLGETIIQGYYMHQGVGMWFMLFTLGLVYYFLPQQLNKPIYSL